ncbi:MAG: hypothetical protein ABEH86_07165 [Haloarcula sp.]
MNVGSGTSDEFMDSTSSVLLLARESSDAESDGCSDHLSERNLSEAKMICVKVTGSPDSHPSLWQQWPDDEQPAEVAVIDIGSNVTTECQVAGSETFSLLTLDTLSSAVEPIDIGLAVSYFIGRWEQSDSPVVVCLHSVTGLLQNWERERVISLVTALNRQCANADVFSHHHMDPESHTEETIEMFRPLYDAVYESIPDHGWTVTGAPQNVDTPTFRDSVTPPGGVAKGEPEKPETIPIPYSFDQVLDLVSSPRRRCLLYHLKDRSEHSMELDELAKRIYEREKAIPARSTPKSCDEVSVSLAHNHLPRLDELGILSYDSDENGVEYYPNPALESVIRYVERLELG